MDLGWNESALRVDPKCDPSGTKVEGTWSMLDFKWILDGMKVHLEWIQSVIQVEPK